ncbi:hypothetical protein IEQ34_017987 [Dendrobium chrysotoxum]|uniref:Peptidase M16 C-terminal domain-containing protein n=1 Tax=Dendrobium chrysotoxum TaxID=161865 RepID=A0AAV7GE33_DENCH|nr:hypothetical protein IEQ34_017987 [Dendrobium chrysotoxum]
MELSFVRSHLFSLTITLIRSLTQFDLRVLNKYQQVHSFSAFSSMFNDTGLFGIFLTTGSDFVAKAVDVAAAELQAIATPGQVTQVELDRAKNATRSAILMNLESRAIVAEDIGRQILTYGSRKPVEHFLRCLDELNLDDLTVLAQKILSSPLTMGCMGDDKAKNPLHKAKHGSKKAHHNSQNARSLKINNPSQSQLHFFTAEIGSAAEWSTEHVPPISSGLETPNCPKKKNSLPKDTYHEIIM